MPREADLCFVPNPKAHLRPTLPCRILAVDPAMEPEISLADSRDLVERTLSGAVERMLRQAPIQTYSIRITTAALKTKRSVARWPTRTRDAYEVVATRPTLFSRSFRIKTFRI